MMRPKVLVTRAIFPDVIEHLRPYFDVEVNEGPRYSAEQFKTALHGIEGVLLAGGEKVDAELLNGQTSLRAICVTAAGYNSVNVPDCTKAGVIVTNSPGPADETVADFAWGLMLATARRIVEGDRYIREGNWTASVNSRFFGTNLCDKTLGIIGMGRIGQAIARRAIGFRMKTLYYNRRRLDPALEADCKASYATKEDLLKNADFVMLALPLTPDNYHTIGAAELALMHPGSMLFNIARGGLIDEAALATALRGGAIAAAGLDVFEGEPSMHPDLPNLSNIVLTPHIAGATYDTQHGLAEMAAVNLIAALGFGPNAGHPPAILNPEVLDRTNRRP